MFKSAAIPPPNFFGYPLKVTIRILPDSRIDLLVDGLPPMPTPISISPAGLANLSQQLQSAVANIAVSNETAKNYTPEEMENELRTLAKLGNYAFRLIFAHPDAQAVMQGLPDGSSIEIVSENFVIPWQLLYSADITQPISCTNFWGMKYNICYSLIGRNYRRGPWVSPHIEIVDAPWVGLLTYNELPAVSKHEIPFFESLDHAGSIKLVKLRALDSSTKDAELGEFLEFWKSNDFHVAHFACHAEYSDIGPNLSEIVLSEDFSITLQDMVIFDLQINSHPLVIMNACETNNLNPLYSSHFAGQFLDRGARGVVTTECRVPDSFASAFIQNLYERLFAGIPIGESLLVARKHFWHKFNNPSGLLYASYGPAVIQIKKENQGE